MDLGYLWFERGSRRGHKKILGAFTWRLGGPVVEKVSIIEEEALGKREPQPIVGSHFHVGGESFSMGWRIAKRGESWE